MKRIFVILLGLAVLAVAANAPAAIITIDFDNVDSSIGWVESGQNWLSDPYLEDGFKVADGGLLRSYGAGNANYAGSLGLHRAGSGPIMLTEQGGNPFALWSIELAPLLSGGALGSVEFTGRLNGTVTASQTFTSTSTTFGFEEFNFDSSFNNVDFVYWYQPGNPGTAHQFDNIVVNTEAGTSKGSGVIPEPSTVVIWSLLGALGLTVGWYRRRKNG